MVLAEEDQETFSRFPHQKEADNVDPDADIAEPAQTLQTANAARDHADDHDYDHACNEADREVSELV